MVVSVAMEPVLAAHVLLTLSSPPAFSLKASLQLRLSWMIIMIKIILDDYLDWDYPGDHHYEAISVKCNRLSCQEI